MLGEAVLFCLEQSMKEFDLSEGLNYTLQRAGCKVHNRTQDTGWEVARCRVRAVWCKVQVALCWVLAERSLTQRAR